MVRAGQSGNLHDFFIYGGKHSAGAERMQRQNHFFDWWKRSQRIPKSYQVFFDNWFSNLPPLIKLQSMRILSTATLRSNREEVRNNLKQAKTI